MLLLMAVMVVLVVVFVVVLVVGRCFGGIGGGCCGSGRDVCDGRNGIIVEVAVFVFILVVLLKIVFGLVVMAVFVLV